MRKTYFEGYKVGLIFTACSIALLLVSGAINPISEKYYVKSFILGVLAFSMGASQLICPGTTRGVDMTDTRYRFNQRFRVANGITKFVWIAYPSLGVILALYLIISETVYMAPIFAKISVLFTLALLAVKSFVKLILSLLTLPEPAENENYSGQQLTEKDDKEPWYIWICLLLISLGGGFGAWHSFTLTDFYNLTQEYPPLEYIMEKQAANHYFSQKHLEDTVSFRIKNYSREGRTNDYYYLIDDEHDPTLASCPVWQLVLNAINEGADIAISYKKLPYTFSQYELKNQNEVLSYLTAKGLDTSFKGRISNDDQTFNEDSLRKIAENLCQAALENEKIPVIVDDALSYNYEYLTAWMIPNFCEYKGIDMKDENWTENLKGYTMASLDEVFAFLCDDDTNDKNGIAFNIGTEDVLLIPHGILREVWHELAGK